MVVVMVAGPPSLKEGEILPSGGVISADCRNQQESLQSDIYSKTVHIDHNLTISSSTILSTINPRTFVELLLLS